MSLAQGATNHGLWPTAWKLIRLRLLISVNGFRRAKRGRKVGTVVLVVALGVLMYFVFTVTGAFLSFMRSPELSKIIPDATTFINSLPVMVLGGAFLGILLTSFGVLLQALYLAGDMDFLLSAPIPMRAVFLTKLLQAILPNFGLSCLVALPLLFGLGSVAGYQAVYYPLVVVTLAALALAAAGVSSLLVMFIVRLFPARRVAEILGFRGALVSILCSQSGQLVNFSEASSSQALVAARLVSRVANLAEMLESLDVEEQRSALFAFAPRMTADAKTREIVIETDLLGLAQDETLSRLPTGLCINHLPD